jgi:hypothetical protein
VVDTRTSSDSGPATVDVTVPSIDAAPLAALAATGRIALILDSGAN